MPIGLFENELTVQLWQPATVRGYTFNVGDNVTLDQTKIEKTPPVGGDFAWLFATYQADRTGNPFESFWNRLPPPLLREGTKVQTPWLTGFLKDPHMIRPAAQLRMPRFHYGKSDQAPSHETEELANYFAARDRTEFPYQTIPEQNSSYLAERNKAHPDYLAAGWLMMTNKASPCLQCHAIGQFKPSGGDQVVNGPDLRGVAPRFRPDYPHRLDRQSAPAHSVYGDAPKHRTPWNGPDPGAQDVRESTIRDGQGGPGHAPQLCERRRAPARQQRSRRYTAPERPPRLREMSP